MEKAKDILSLSHSEALDFYMDKDRYCCVELPQYFDFQGTLDSVRKAVGAKSLSSICREDPKGVQGVNIDVLANKDGFWGVRPFSIVNPYLYYLLARDICKKGNWEKILSLMGTFKVPRFSACAITVVPDKNKKESFHGATSILNWWNKMEQGSIELALQYRYMFVSDITDCYGSISSRAIADAFSLKGTDKENYTLEKLSEKVILYIESMQEGKNIGIPQGNALSDLIAEIVLGYADLLLYSEIGKEGIKCEYEVLRYRDDYRIFCNDRDSLEKISYLLQRVLRRLGLKMNTKKTVLTDDIITGSVKEDKLYYIANTPIYKRRRVPKIVYGKDGKASLKYETVLESDFGGLQKCLLFTLLFGRKFPNSGQIKTQLSNFDKRLSEVLGQKGEKGNGGDPLDEIDPDDAYCVKVPTPLPKAAAKKGNVPVLSDRAAPKKTVLEDGTDLLEILNMCSFKRRPVWESIAPMVSIAVQIAIDNIGSAHYALRIISRLIDTLDNDDPKKKELILKVGAKLREQHDTNYLEIWLQNITFAYDRKKDVSGYTHPLCRLVMGDTSGMWNSSWVKDSLGEIPYGSILSREILDTLSPVIVIKSRCDY